MARQGQFKKGNAGKPKGAINKLNRTVKETVLAVFNDMQQDPKANLLAWGTDNPTEFYKIAAKLIPTEVNANVEVHKKELPPFMRSNESES